MVLTMGKSFQPCPHAMDQASIEENWYEIKHKFSHGLPGNNWIEHSNTHYTISDC